LFYAGGVNQCGLNSNYSSTPDDGGLLLPLDVAIRKSIEACPTDELKKKMFGCILLVGGGIRFKGVTKYLHQRLSLQVT
jgi:actin-related protein 8